jgi:hypothetical protein
MLPAYDGYGGVVSSGIQVASGVVPLKGSPC